jgi:protein PhnA
MSTFQALMARSNGFCELCKSTTQLNGFLIPPKTEDSTDNSILLCNKCLENKDQPSEHSSHWDCLNDTAWSTEPAVQVMTYRLLTELESQSWADNLKDQMYLDEMTAEWANFKNSAVEHRDSNGILLSDGDSVTLIKDLEVKGANFTAKRGTSVKRIRLVEDNPNQIEGKVNDQHIVILCQYVKKS